MPDEPQDRTARAPLITAFEIENFKGIGRSVRVDLRPITLLFGSNSAGKSTILHALCYAHEILSHRNVDAHRTELGGDQIDLGGFRNFVHGHDVNRKVRLRFVLDLKGWRVPDPLWDKIESPIEIPGYSAGLDRLSDAVETGWVALEVDGHHGQPGVVSYEVGVNDALVGRICSRHGNRASLAFNPSHPLLEPNLTITQNRWMNAPDLGSPGPRVLPDMDSSIWLTTGGESPSVPLRQLSSPLPYWDDVLVPQEDKWRDIVRGVLQIEGPSRERYTEPSFSEFQLVVSSLLVGIGRSLRDELALLRYVGPLREIHRRDSLGLQPNDRDWANGAAAWDLLNDNAGGDSSVIRDASDWLSNGERLDTGYKLRVQSVVELPGDGPLVTELVGLKPGERTSTGSKEPGSEAQQSPGDVLRAADPSLLDALAEQVRQGVRKRVELVSTRIDRRVRTSDIGVGISQILPVVVAALDPDRPQITAIEQPELHIHPRLQVELGDLFAQQAVNGGIFMIETHSEHLLLRIMRRMRQTKDDKLPDGAPGLHPDDVAVFFVEPDGAETLVREMPLNERGELVKAWPGGFFEEDLREIF